MQAFFSVFDYFVFKKKKEVIRSIPNHFFF